MEIKSLFLSISRWSGDFPLKKATTGDTWWYSSMNGVVKQAKHWAQPPSRDARSRSIWKRFFRRLPA